MVIKETESVCFLSEMDLIDDKFIDFIDAVVDDIEMENFISSLKYEDFDIPNTFNKNNYQIILDIGGFIRTLK